MQQRIGAPARSTLVVAVLAFAAGMAVAFAAAAPGLRAQAVAPVPGGMAGTSDGFLPHGFCFLWNRPLLWTHVVADTLIGLSYIVIAGTLVLFIRRARRDLPFSYIFLAFGLFIVACGGTHFMEVWTFWQPVYWLSAGVKVVTAVASVSTAALLPFTVPRVHLTIREAKLAREREREAARAAALEESNVQLRAQATLLEAQAVELNDQRGAAVRLATQLGEANDELARLNASLEQTLADARAAHMAADSARQRAEEASAAKGDFLAVMSHELRTPLQAVIGYADLLQLGVSGPVTEAQSQQLARIRSSARHLVGLIDEILTYSRLAAQAEVLQVEAFDAAAVAEEAADMVRPLAATRGLVLDVTTPPPGAARMLSDPQRVRQALLNLLTNAVKYTPSGAVTLNVAVEAAGSGLAMGANRPGASPGGDAAVVFRVRDTGIGIAPEHHPRVFEPFWQAAPPLTRGVGGTGLGLSVVRELARALGGEITLESAVGQGSTFTLRLPVHVPTPLALAS